MAGQIDDKNGTGKRTVSIRQIETNRKNALKSTGPKTQRGKAYSGRNAIKHGLFSRQRMDFIAHGEDAQEYRGSSERAACPVSADRNGGGTGSGTSRSLLVETQACVAL